MNQLSFGAPPGDGPGDACGRCFSITGTVDPNTGAQASSTIVVKVTDLCSVSEDYCGQTLSNPINSLNQPMQCVLFPISFVAHRVLMNARLQLPIVSGYGRPRGILPVWK